MEKPQNNIRLKFLFAKISKTTSLFVFGLIALLGVTSMGVLSYWVKPVEPSIALPVVGLLTNLISGIVGFYTGASSPEKFKEPDPLTKNE